MANEVNYRQIFGRKKKLKQDWLKLCPNLNDNSGIYILTREEDGIKYGYIGQAKHILTRLVSHSEGFVQHIDRSLKNHKLYSKNNPCGWKVTFGNYPEDKLNEMEQYYIKEYANLGYQLRNKTTGSQGESKEGLNDNAQSKGYREGIYRGREKLAEELRYIIDKYLVISLKKDNKLSNNALEKFYYLLQYKEQGEQNGQTTSTKTTNDTKV